MCLTNPFINTLTIHSKYIRKNVIFNCFMLLKCQRFHSSSVSIWLYNSAHVKYLRITYGEYDRLSIQPGTYIKISEMQCDVQACTKRHKLLEFL